MAECREAVVGRNGPAACTRRLHSAHRSQRAAPEMVIGFAAVHARERDWDCDSLTGGSPPDKALHTG